MFTGGPIKSLAWVPLLEDLQKPSTYQYLAIACRKSMDKYARVLFPQISPSLVLIYKFTYNLNVTNDSQTSSEIIYGLKIDNSPIHQLEFLPSGGYEPKLNRLGLLAVATVQTHIKIYALPLTVPKRNNKLPLITVPPSFVLTLDLSGSLNNSKAYDSHCVKLVWSKVSNKMGNIVQIKIKLMFASQTFGHVHIFAAYQNGFIAIWDISDDEDGNLNRFIVNEQRHFVPLSYFFCGEKEPVGK